MLFDSTSRRELASSFGATLVVILTIVITIMLIRTIAQAAGGVVAPQDVALLLGYTALGQLPTMLALSLFIAVVLTLGRIYRDSEMAIWMGAGLGLSHFVAPVLRMASPVLLVISVLVVFVWPWGNRSSVELRDRYQQRSDLSRIAPGVFQISRDGRRVFFIDRDSAISGDGQNVFIMAEGGDVEAVTSARSGRLVPDRGERMLQLRDGERVEINRRSGERTIAGFSTYRVLASDSAVRRIDNPAPKTLDTVDLIASPAPRNVGELAWRLGLVLASANLLLLGIGLSAVNPRRATNWNLMFSLLTFIVYFNLLNLSQAWIGSGRFAFGPTLIAVHGGAFVVACTLLWWRDHAAVWQAPWRRQPR
jgi:lipopolysaccharide export system permease protein